MRALARWTLRLLRIGVTAGLLIFVIRRAGADALAKELGKVSPGWLALATLLNVAFVTLGVYRWRLLITPRPAGLTMKALMRVHLMSAFYGALAPGTLGVDAVRAILLSKRGTGRTAAVISVSVDRTIGFLGTFSSAMPALMASGLVAKLAAVPWTGRIGEIRGKAWRALSALAREPWRLVAGYGLALGAMAIWGAIGWCTLTALGHPVPWTLLVGFVASAELASAVPISVQGIGVRELVFTTFLAPYGVSTADATLLGLLLYAQGLAIVSAGALTAVISHELPGPALETESP